MANEEHLKLLKQDIKTWNRWREEHPDIRPNLLRANLLRANLTEANLSEANLRRANLSWANLTEANFSQTNLLRANLSRANLTEANLSKANLRGANLSWANIRRANLTGADLTDEDLTGSILIGADLSNADLRGSNLIGSILTEANLTGVGVGWTTFGDVDLSEVRGFDTVRHEGPSTIGIDTISCSNGIIPGTFLRDCGLSDWEIEATKLYRPHLTSAEFTDITYKMHELRIIAIHYYSCFISYSSKDEAFAQRLHADLQSKGVRCWFAPEDLKIGAKIRPTIDETIRLHDKLLLVLSEHSVSSQWVEQEVETALARERKQDQTVLFPIRLDDAVMDMEGGWPALIKNTRNIGNFSQWKAHDAYQKAFTRLLRDLKAEGTKTST